MIRRLLATDDNVAAFIARVTLGLVIFPHGAQKLLGWFGGYGFTGTMKAMTEMGFPSFLVVLLILTESIGALLLVAGFLSRIDALGIAVIMLVAVVKVHMANGFFMNWFGTQKGEGFEYHLLALGLALAVMVVGGGRWSVDRALSTRTTT